jgi:hypothetical protein
MFQPIMAIIGMRPTLKKNASYILHAYCLVWVTLVLRILKIDLLKLIQFSISLAVNLSDGRVPSQ